MLLFPMGMEQLLVTGSRKLEMSLLFEVHLLLCSWPDQAMSCSGPSEFLGSAHSIKAAEDGLVASRSHIYLAQISLKEGLVAAYNGSSSPGLVPS